MQRRDFLGLATLMGLHSGLQAEPQQPKRKSGIVLDPGFKQHWIQSGHPESPARYHALEQRLMEQDLLNLLQLMTPTIDAEDWLHKIHSDWHIEQISSNDPEAHSAALLATSAMLTATDAVCRGKVDNAFSASRPPGHHAENGGAEEGFCYYNHIAIAARYAQQKFALERVLIVDWDYHHGNGTEWAFYDDPSVLFFSTHDWYAYPGTGDPGKTGKGAGEGFNINVHLPCGSGDAEIIEAFEHYLLPAADAFKPDLVLISAGFDSRHDDWLGCHLVTDDGFARLTRMVMQIADKHCNGRVVSVLEGGYNLEGNALAVISHVRALMQPMDQ